MEIKVFLPLPFPSFSVILSLFCPLWHGSIFRIHQDATSVRNSDTADHTVSDSRPVHDVVKPAGMLRPRGQPDLQAKLCGLCLTMIGLIR